QIERFEPREGHRISRVAIDILRPVPVGRLVTQVSRLQRGRRVELIEATASSGSEVVLIARAWRVEAVAPEVPQRTRSCDPSGQGAVENHEPHPQVMDAGGQGYLAAIDWSFERGSFEDYGPAKAWARPRVRLVDDEEISGWQRVITIVDSGSGISMAFPPTEHP